MLLTCFVTENQVESSSRKKHKFGGDIKSLPQKKKAATNAALKYGFKKKYATKYDIKTKTLEKI